MELPDVIQYSISSDNKFLIINKGGSPGTGLWDEKYQVYSYQNNKYELVWEDYKKLVNTAFEKSSNTLEGTLTVDGDTLTYEYKNSSMDNDTKKEKITNKGIKVFNYKSGKFELISNK